MTMWPNNSPEPPLIPVSVPPSRLTDWAARLSFCRWRPDMNPLGCKNDLRRKLADGKTLDDALAELRTSGYSIIDCISAVQRVQDCEFIDAKKTVHFSPAWADMRAGHEKFHQELEDLAKEIADEDA